MRYETKKLSKRAFLIYAALNILAYAFAHVAYLYANEASGEVYEYISYYLSKSFEFIAVPILATLTYLVLMQDGKHRALGFAAILSSARVFYSLPYYYIIFIYNYGYDSVESLVLSILASLAVMLATVIGIFACIGICRLAIKLIQRKEGNDKDEDQKAKSGKAPLIDFLSMENLPILVFALSRFAFSLARELVDTVTFFIEYHSDYTPTEIITILLNFVLLFALLVISYIAAGAIKNSLTDVQEDNE